MLCVKRDEQELPVGNFSKKLVGAQLHYSATELECLALVKAIEHFEVYLTGQYFRVKTDHRALQFLQTARHLNSRLTRWALRLQTFNFEVTYRPGRKNNNADGLSRQTWGDEEKNEIPTPCEVQSALESQPEGGGDVKGQVELLPH